MTTVTLRPDESQERLHKRFPKKVKKDRFLSETMKNRFLHTNSAKSLIALQKARRRESRRQQKKKRAMRIYN